MFSMAPTAPAIKWAHARWLIWAPSHPDRCSPNGRNINDGCGSTSPELLQLTVPAVRADVGIALDGDGDRVAMVDENGALVDGDQLLYILATSRKTKGA